MCASMVVFCRSRPPPRSTLFPYTTLFRSDGRPGRAPAQKASQEVEDRSPRRPRGSDRKSTRLNSSHSQISYAVFCLKKKITYASDGIEPVHRMPAVELGRPELDVERSADH